MIQFKCSNLLLATRITTFEDPDWPHGAHYGYALADAGFFYLGRGNTVQCCKCDLQLCRWDPKNDDPIAEHSRESPNCELKFQQKVDLPDYTTIWVSLSKGQNYVQSTLTNSFNSFMQSFSSDIQPGIL